MKNSKLIQVLKTFSAEDWKKFEKFAKSPYFNNGRNYLTLIKYLKKYSPGFESSSFTRQNLYETLFPEKHFKLSVIKSMMNGLTRLAEDFIVHSALENNRTEKHKVLNDVLIERKVYDYFKKNLRKSDAELNNTAIRTPDYYYYKVKFSYQDLKANIGLNKEYTNLSILYLAARNNLLNYFLYEILNLYCNYSQMQVKEILWEEMTFLDEILDYLGKNNYSSEPVLEIYYNIIKLKQTQDKAYYSRLLSLLNIYDKNISYPDKKIAYFIMYSFITDKVNRNDYSLFNELVHLVDVFTEYGFSNNESGYMSDVFFRNTVAIYNIMKKFKESENFVNKNYTLLKPGLRTNTFNYCIGLIKLQSGFQSEALEIFSKIRYEDSLMKLSVDNIKLALFYELNYIENCYTLIDSINIYIRSNPGIRKIYSNPYLNFNKSIKKLLMIKENPDKYDLAVLKKKITSENELFAKNWLLKKIEEIEKQ